MEKSLQTGHLPSNRIIEAIDASLGTEWPWDFPDDRLAPTERYWSPNDLKKMLGHGAGARDEWVEFDLADKLLCCLNLHELWYSELEDIYLEVYLGPVRVYARKTAKGVNRCAAPGCSNEFTPWGKRKQKYCSQACGNRARRESSGRYGTQYGTCPKGHDRSPENTYDRPGGGTACRVCRREAAAEKYRSNAEHRAKKVQAERARRAAMKAAA